MDGGAWQAAVHGVAKSRARLSDFTFTFHFHALKKEMAAHSSVLAWRIPGTAEPGGLPSMGSHRVGHDWSDSAAAAIIFNINLLKGIVQQKKRRGLNRGSLPILHIWFLCKNYGVNQKLCHCTNRAIFLCHRMSVAPQKHKSYRSNVLKVLSTEGLSV